MLNHRIRGLLFHYKKNVILQFSSIFLVRVFRNTLFPSVKMTLTINKMIAYVMGAYSPCDVCKSKHDVIHKSLALCRSLLLSIGPFSAPQAEYSAYTYSIQNNRLTAAVKLENTSNTTP